MFGRLLRLIRAYHLCLHNLCMVQRASITLPSPPVKVPVLGESIGAVVPGEGMATGVSGDLTRAHT